MCDRPSFVLSHPSPDVSATPAQMAAIPRNSNQAIAKRAFSIKVSHWL